MPASVESLLSQVPGNRDVLCLAATNLRLSNRIHDALAHLDALAQYHPRYSQLYQERGYCYTALHDSAKAIDAFRRAVSINAALPGSWQMLHTLYQNAGDEENASMVMDRLATLRALPSEIIQAGSLFADGDLIQAERILRLYLTRYGEHIEAMRMLGRICTARGLRDDAELLLAAVVQRAPGYRAARADHVRALLDQRKYSQSRQQAQQLRELDPGNRAYLKLYAEACIRLGDYESGISLCQELLGDAQPGHETAELHLWIAHSLRAMGRQAQAIQDYHAAIIARPDFGEAWWALADLKTYSFSDEELARMRAAESAPATASADRHPLCFALGKALEERRDFTASWQYYERGNALKHAEISYQPQIAEINTRLSTQVFTREFFAARQGWGTPDADPIFVLGLPRSGSTLIEQILASHSQIEGTRELPEIQCIVRELLGRLPDPYNPRYPAVLTGLESEDFRRFGERFMRDTRIYRRTCRPFFIDKMTDNFRYIGLIHLMLPNAKIIDARREPMACCFGNLKQLFHGGQEFSYSVADIARYYRTYLEIMRHWNAVLPNRILLVQHEDVVASLESSVRRILDFCALPFEPACLEYHRTVRSVSTASSEQVRRPISRGTVDQWRNYQAWLGPLQHALGNALTTYRE